MIDYTRKTSTRSSKMKLSINRDGAVVVTAPPFVPKMVIERFIKENESWIQQHQNKRLAKVPQHGGTFSLFGKPYTLEYGYDATLKTGWQIIGDKLLYNNSRYLLQPKTSPQLTSQELDALEKFGRQTIFAYISKRIPQLHEQMGIPQPVNRIVIKDQGTRWGSCSTGNNLNFNWRLVNHEPAVIDYVLIHELAHMIHMNHSDKFWALVAKYDGNYKLHRRILNH